MKNLETLTTLEVLNLAYSRLLDKLDYEQKRLEEYPGGCVAPMRIQQIRAQLADINTCIIDLEKQPH